MSGAFPNNNGLQLDAKQTQQQHLTMKQRQALEVLFLSRQELDTQISEILMHNPLIEVVENLDEPGNYREQPEPERSGTEDESLYDAELAESSDSWSDALSDSGDFPENDGGNAEESGFGEDDFHEDESGDSWELDPAPESEWAEGSSETADDFLNYTPAQNETIQEILQSELNVMNDLPENIRHGAEYIILCLDDDGMLRTPLEDIAMSSGCSMGEIRDALELVQQFDPPGIGARSVPECLLLQLKRNGRWTPLYEKLLTEMFEELKRNRPDIAASKLEISMDELKSMFQELSKLSMVPVSGNSSAVAVITPPEVEIVPDEEKGFIARLLKEPRSYKLSPYAEMAHAPDAGSDFAAKAREGMNLLEALEFRKGTILRMAEMLIDVQRPFLESGPEKLRPFTMKQAAEYLKFKSESTISRAAASKYIRTPHGVFPFKYFFTAGYVSEGGTEVSRTADMELLKKLVDEEDKKHPLSDDKLSQLLNKAGHPVARRTVAKYRDLMNIPSSSLRKEHF